MEAKKLKINVLKTFISEKKLVHVYFFHSNTYPNGTFYPYFYRKQKTYTFTYFIQIVNTKYIH